MKGATPEGTHGEQDAARWVRAMFDRIAPRYDLANHVVSFNIDRSWRARTVARVRPVLCRPGARVLDLCCGTGDLTMALEHERGGPVMGSDFCHPMLRAAARKGPGSVLFEADALQLPLSNASIDLITIAFGFRNLANYPAGLAELRRVLRRGGMLAILECSRPPNPAIRAFYNLYAGHILPLIGGALSGSRDAYSYLPESVRKFPAPPVLAEMMRAAGFAEVTFERMTLGVVALHIARVH